MVYCINLFIHNDIYHICGKTRSKKLTYQDAKLEEEHTCNNCANNCNEH